MNNNTIYRTMKVFDCQDMPKDLCHAFLRMWDDRGNDSAVEWTISDTVDPDELTRQIDEWLIKNGAQAAKDENSCGEEVLIKYWW